MDTLSKIGRSKRLRKRLARKKSLQEKMRRDSDDTNTILLTVVIVITIIFFVSTFTAWAIAYIKSQDTRTYLEFMGGVFSDIWMLMKNIF